MPELKPQQYKDHRPAEEFLRFHEQARTRDPGWVYGAARILSAPISLFLYRTWPIGVDNVPARGPVILAANHFSNYDHFLIGVWLRRQIRFVAKSQLFGNPVLNFIFKNGAVIPVRRGHRDEETFVTMRKVLLDRGGCVLIYVEGGRSRQRGLGEVKPGVGRAALEWGVPVVPVLVHGSQGIRGWRRLRFPKVTIRFGEPMRFEAEPAPSRERQLECAEEIFAEVRRMYEELERDDRRTVIRRLREQGETPSHS